MITLRSRTAARPVFRPGSGPAFRTVRRLLTVLMGFVAVLAVPAVASADTPESWTTPPPVSGLDFLLMLLIFPLGLALIITVLTVLPSIVRDKGYKPGQSWRSEAEWFGGPAKGVSAAEDAPDASGKQVEAGPGAASDRGGASGSW